MSQNNKAIEKHKVIGGYTYSRDGKKLNLFQLPGIIGDNERLSQDVSKVTPMLIIGLALVFIGVFLATFSITFGIFQTVNWTTVTIGAALAVVGYLLYQGPYRKLNKLIDEYNSDISA